jgi:phosphoribosylamine-glycine ligase
MSILRLTEEQLVEMIQQVILEKKKKKKKKSKKKDTKLCSRGKKAAQAKFEVYPSAYANGYAVQVCKGTMPGLDGKKRCSGKYCSGKK